jgi:hypothetical protein
VVNWLLLELHERLRLASIRAYPEKLIVETINACDSTCRLCPVGEGRRSRPPRCWIWFSTSASLTNWPPYAREVHLQNWGEPILDHLVARIQYAHKRNLFTSTLHRLSPAGAEALVSSGLDSIAISLHRVRQKTYESYQPGHSLDAVLANVRMLVAARTNLGMKTPRVTLLFVRSRQNAGRTAPDSCTGSGPGRWRFFHRFRFHQWALPVVGTADESAGTDGATVSGRTPCESGDMVSGRCVV